MVELECRVNGARETKTIIESAEVSNPGKMVTTLTETVMIGFQ